MCKGGAALSATDCANSVLAMFTAWELPFLWFHDHSSRGG
jgi:hypothetical protein